MPRSDPAYLLYRTGALVAPRVPLGLAELTGTVIARVNAKRRTVVRRNLARVVEPERLEAAVDEAFRSYARYWIEVLRVPAPGPDEIARRTTVEGIAPMAAHLDAGRGVIFVTPHVGNWDIAGAWLALRWPVVAIAEELRPPELYDLFVKLRRDVGVEVHPLGRASSARALLTALKRGSIVGLVADRDISGSGVEVEFFGEKTYLPTGPAVLAMRTGAALAAGAFYHRPGGRYHGVILDPIEVERSRDGVEALTQRVARDLETLIRREPGQWHLFQPNWPSDPGYRGA